MNIFANHFKNVKSNPALTIDQNSLFNHLFHIPDHFEVFWICRYTTNHYFLVNLFLQQITLYILHTKIFHSLAPSWDIMNSWFRSFMILRDFGYVQVGLTTPIWTPDKFVAFKSNHMQKNQFHFLTRFSDMRA